jgi:dipicolinate synthase subunit B
MKRLISAGMDIQPILSESVYMTDTRFHLAEEMRLEVEALTGRRVIHTVAEAEPLGPSTPLEALIIAPCTGNTLAKMAHGITDTAVTMAAKAHLRCDRPLLIALATNDAMSQNLGNIGTLLNRKSVYFVPMKQDSPKNKPHSLVADFSRLEESFYAMQHGAQIRPLFL